MPPENTEPRLAPPSSAAIPTDASNNEHQSDPSAFWKRRYYSVQDAMSVLKASKRKQGNTTIPTSQLGQGIRKVVFICGEIKDLVSESDKHCTYLDDPDDTDLKAELGEEDSEESEELKRNWERSHSAIQVLKQLIPNFQQKIDQDSPEELHMFYSELQRGADSARSDDLNRIRACVAEWLNSADPRPEVLLDPHSRKNRGLQHDVTGRLLCPAEFDWNNLITRAKLRAGDENFDWLSSYHSRCFYANYEPDASRLESGYLKSTLLIQVFKAIFTSPSSAREVSKEQDDAENIPPVKVRRTMSTTRTVRRNVASKVQLNNRVTPRSIAYAAVQLHFNLQCASSWAPIYGGFDYLGLYNYIVDFFEDAPGTSARKRVKDLLNWWSKKVFPDAATNRQSNTSSSRKAFKQQRMARELEEADNY